MIIGSEDYLSSSIHAEFADAIVDQFEDVGRILTDWHLEGMQADLLSSEVKEQRTEDILITQEVKDLFEVVVPGDPVEERDGQSEATEDTKFCINCGTKLPLRAKFCSSCGSEQPSTDL